MVLAVLGMVMVAAGGAAAFLIRGFEPEAGALVAAVGALLVIAGLLARRSGTPRSRFADSSIERLAEGVVLGAIAWERLPLEPRTAAAALVALGSGTVAAYLRSRATALGFHLEESVVDRGVRIAVIAVGLLSGLLEGGLWAAAGWSIVTATTRAFDVAGQQS